MQHNIQVYQLATINRVGIEGFFRSYHKAPDIALIRIFRIYLIDPPIVSCARNKPIRIGKSGEADSIIR